MPTSLYTIRVGPLDSSGRLSPARPVSVHVRVAPLSVYEGREQPFTENPREGRGATLAEAFASLGLSVPTALLTS